MNKKSQFISYDLSANQNKGRWLSGRKRQTVNLLGNSRWFEPNSSHTILYKCYPKENCCLKINIRCFSNTNPSMIREPMVK